LAAKKYEEAVEHFSSALQSIKGPAAYSLLIQRSSAYFGLRIYTKSLHDAVKAVELNSTSGDVSIFSLFLFALFMRVFFHPHPLHLLLHPVHLISSSFAFSARVTSS
jgi:tetratricopeptide (TPR) repeat protein